MNLDDHAIAARGLKESMEWDDLAPMLVVEVGDKIHVMEILGPGGPWMHATIAAIVKAYRPRRITVVTDAYYGEPVESESAPRLVRGELKERFDAGDPSVHECLNLTTYDGLKMRSRTLPYDADARKWLKEPFEPDRDDLDVHGAVPDAIRNAWWEGAAGSENN